jgi:hypothetical protein
VFADVVSGMDVTKDMDFPLFHMWKSTSPRPAMAFQSLAGRHQIAFLLENAAAAVFERALRLLVPFLEAARVAFLADAFRDCARGLGAFVGLGEASARVWNATAWLVPVFLAGDLGPAVIVGHRPGALIAKALAVGFNGTAVAFEPLDVRTSAIWWSIPNRSAAHWQIVNVGAAGSLFPVDTDEDEEAQNVDLAGRQAWLSPDNAYETFCRIASACAVDDRFDAICNATIGIDKYVAYFHQWRRTRQGPQGRSSVSVNG